MNKIICFDKDILRSKAFRSLSKWSFLAYMDFLRKRQMEKVKNKNRSPEWVIKNNGDIVYPYLEAENKGIGRREFRNAIDELIEKGFLDIAHQGSGGRSGDMTKYFIDDRWKGYGTPSFQSARNPRKKDSRKGKGWAAFHANRKQSPVTKMAPKKALSSNKSVIPDGKSRILSSDSFAISKPRQRDSTSCNYNNNNTQTQLSLWGNTFDTIL